MLYKKEYIDNNKLLKEEIKSLKEANADHKRLNGELRKEIELLQNDLDSTDSKLSEVSKRCIKAIEIIRQDWYKKNTIPIEEIGTSNDLRVELFKTLLGVDKSE